MADSIPIHGIEYHANYQPDQRNHRAGHDRSTPKKSTSDDATNQDDGDAKETQDKQTRGLGKNVDLEA